MNRLRVAFVPLLLALLLPGGAAAYPWPFKPFDRQHPIRGFFGDPRTTYYGGILDNPFGMGGFFSFHQGVDIAAPNGTPVYAIADGTANYLGAQTLELVARNGVIFQYFHIVGVAGEEQVVYARKTVLGYVQPPFGHVHITEIDGRHAVNPLLPGHLTPYRDTTRPTVRAIEVSGKAGLLQPPLDLCGRVQLAADAYDTTPIPVPDAFRGFPVTPALGRWTISRVGDHAVVVPWQVVADFRQTLPPNSKFWAVYAHGTYQNAPRFGKDQYSAPGRYLFLLARSYDTASIPNGTYRITVQATDERGNTGSASQRISVRNTPGAQCAASLTPGSSPPPAPPEIH
jgi:hypothetical protein